MSQINDCEFIALTKLGFTGQLNDMELAWLQSIGATAEQINDAWLEIAPDTNEVPSVINPPLPTDFTDAYWRAANAAVIIDANTFTVTASTNSNIQTDPAFADPTFTPNAPYTIRFTARSNVNGPFRPSLFSGGGGQVFSNISLTTVDQNFELVINAPPVVGNPLQFTLQSNGAALTVTISNVTIKELGAFGQINDAKIAYFLDQGAVGEQYNDIEFDFWCRVMDGFLTTGEWFLQSRAIDGDGVGVNYLGYSEADIGAGTVAFGDVEPNLQANGDTVRLTVDPTASDLVRFRYLNGNPAGSLVKRISIEGGFAGTLNYNFAGEYSGLINGLSNYVESILQSTIDISIIDIGSSVTVHNFFIQNRVDNGDGLLPQMYGYATPDNGAGTVQFGDLDPDVVETVIVDSLFVEADTFRCGLGLLGGGIGPTSSVNVISITGITALFVWNGVFYEAIDAAFQNFVESNNGTTQSILIEFVRAPFRNSWFIESRVLDGDGLTPDYYGFNASALGIGGSVMFGNLAPPIALANNVTALVVDPNDTVILEFESGAPTPFFIVDADFFSGTLSGPLPWDFDINAYRSYVTAGSYNNAVINYQNNIDTDIFSTQARFPQFYANFLDTTAYPISSLLIDSPDWTNIDGNASAMFLDANGGGLRRTGGSDQTARVDLANFSLPAQIHVFSNLNVTGTGNNNIFCFGTGHTQMLGFRFWQNTIQVLRRNGSGYNGEFSYTPMADGLDHWITFEVNEANGGSDTAWRLMIDGVVINTFTSPFPSSVILNAMINSLGGEAVFCKEYAVWYTQPNFNITDFDPVDFS